MIIYQVHKSLKIKMNETLNSPPIIDPNFKYEVLTPDAYHTQLETPEELQELYIKNTTDLIKTIVGDETHPGYDTVIFLDKSARPLSWMTRELWGHVAPQKENPETGELQTVKMPEMKFVNIDRLNWRKNPDTPIDEPGGGMIDPTEEDLDGIRRIFNIDEKHKLDGKRILIVDEQSETAIH